MHQLNVLILGPNSFISTLNELKPFLKFNSLTEIKNLKLDVILFHVEALLDKKNNEILNDNNCLKVCASNKKKLSSVYDAYLELPASLKEINDTVENVAAKKIFSNNSSIQIKKYILEHY